MTARRRLAAMAAVAALAAGAGTAWGEAPDGARREAILEMVGNTCVACHGPKLVGETGPALTPEALKDRDPAELAAAILNGRPGTLMPAFAGMFTEPEAEWLAGRLKAGLTP